MNNKNNGFDIVTINENGSVEDSNFLIWKNELQKELSSFWKKMKKR